MYYAPDNDGVSFKKEFENDDKVFINHEIVMKKDKVLYRKIRAAIESTELYAEKDEKTFEIDKSVRLKLSDDYDEKIPLGRTNLKKYDKTFIDNEIEVQKYEDRYEDILPELGNYDIEAIPACFTPPPVRDNEKFRLERKYAEEEDKTFVEIDTQKHEDLYKAFLLHLRNDYGVDDVKVLLGRMYLEEYDKTFIDHEIEIQKNRYKEILLQLRDDDKKFPLERKYPEEYDKTFINHDIEIQKNEDCCKEILLPLRDDDDDEKVPLERKYPEEYDKAFIDHEIGMQKNEDHYTTILLPLSDEKFPEDFQYIEDITAINIRIRRLSRCRLESVKYLEEFIEISKCLSSLLPPVSCESLFDVDDLLYGEQIKQNHKSVIGVEFLYHYINFEPYISYYSASVREGVRNIFMDTAVMQLVEHMPMLCQKWPYQHLLQSKEVYGTCVALKILVAAALKKNEKFSFNAHERINEILSFMEYLKHSPRRYYSKGKKIAKFISYHVDKFMKLADLNITVHGFDFFKASIVKMILERFFPVDYHIISLIDTFMNFNSSERDELPSYLFKLMEGTDESVKEALKCIHHRHDVNKPNTLPQKLMRIIFDHIITNTVCLGEKLLNVEEKMKFVDAVYGYKIEPYFPMNNEYKYRAFNNEAFVFDKKFTSFKDSQERELSIEEEDPIIDDLIEMGDNIILVKFFVYDEFMRSLHCLSIFHELFMELERRFKVEFPQSFVYSNFWEMVTTIGLVPWYVKMIVMKCPFLLKSSENKFIHMSFNDLTCKEKEFIEYQNWTDKMFDSDSKSYVDQRFPMSSPVLPAPKNYYVSEKTFSECLEVIENRMKRRREKE